MGYWCNTWSEGLETGVTKIILSGVNLQFDNPPEDDSIKQEPVEKMKSFPFEIK